MTRREEWLLARRMEYHLNKKSPINKDPRGRKPYTIQKISILKTKKTIKLTETPL